jgi:hypothetical protein
LDCRDLGHWDLDHEQLIAPCDVIPISDDDDDDTWILSGFPWSTKRTDCVDMSRYKRARKWSVMNASAKSTRMKSLRGDELIMVANNENNEHENMIWQIQGCLEHE